MPFPELSTLAYHAERNASRRLAERSGCTYEDALLATMQAAAGGAARLPALVAARAAEHAAQAQRSAARDQRRAAGQARRAALKDGAITPWRGWFDGSAWPNPGHCGIGAVLTGPDGQHVAIARAAGYGNSSEAEYRALIVLLHTALEQGAGIGCAGALTIYGDSKVVIDDVTGAAASEAASLAVLREQARTLLARLDQAFLRWIPRHRNSAADALSQQARTLIATDMNEEHP